MRSNFQLDKFLVGFDKNNLIAQNIADFGTAALNSQGQMTAFYGNKRFASRQGSHYVIDSAKIENELLSKGEKVAYDFGSFSVNLNMWELLVDYWKKKNVLNSTIEKGTHTIVKRDIDPHFIQPFVRFLYAMNYLEDRNAFDAQLPAPTTLLTQLNLDEAREQFNANINTISPKAFAYLWRDVNNETDIKKKNEALTCMNEVIEFYLLYRQTAVLVDLKKIFGFIDLGDDTQWFRYRRPIDIMNEKLEMLTDLIEKKIETQLNGEIQSFDADENLLQRSVESRLMRGIKDNKIANFTVEGKPVTLTLAEMKMGKSIEDVYIKNSIIQNCDLTKGSFIVNSVVNHVRGKVIAFNSYLESSTSPLIEATTSVIHQVIDIKQIKADREVVSDVYKWKLVPSYHGQMRAPIGYDPKGMQIYKILGKTENNKVLYSNEFDETIRYFLERIPYDLKDAKEYSDKTARTQDGLFTFEEIREIEPLRIEDKIFRDSIEEMANKAITDRRS